MLTLLTRSSYFWITSGVIISALAYPIWSIFPFAYLSLAFYLAAVYQTKSIRQSIAIAVISAELAAFIAFFWISFTLQEMGHFHWFIATFMHAAFGIIVLPNFTCFFILGPLLRPGVDRLPTWTHPIYWTGLWLALEFLWRPFKIFPEMIGNTQWSWLSISQVASWGGVTAVSFLVVYFGCSLFFIIRNRTHRTYQVHMGVACLFLLTAHVWGSYRIQWVKALPKEDVQIAIVQANIGNAEKAIVIHGNRDGLTRVVDTYKDLTALAAIKKPELILWPETAYPMSFPVTPRSRATPFSKKHAMDLRSSARALGYAHLFGGYETEGREDYNAGILIGSDGMIQGSYRKTHLLIFGEYMPFSDIWPALKNLNPTLGDFGTGPGPFPLTWTRKDARPLKLGLNVCYEALIMNFMRDLANNGSHVFVNFTNDSWFGPGNEPYQHLELAAHRTIENGIPMIRPTNTGISSVIDAAGDLILAGPIGKRTVLHFKVPIPITPIVTIYRRVGEAFAWFIVFLSFGSTLFMLIQARRQNR